LLSSGGEIAFTNRWPELNCLPRKMQRCAGPKQVARIELRRSVGGTGAGNTRFLVISKMGREGISPVHVRAQLHVSTRHRTRQVRALARQMKPRRQCRQSGATYGGGRC
jgi:hypothetical protein